MRVKSAMKSPVITIADTATYQDAARLLTDNHISGAPVVDADGRLVGMLSEKDLFRDLFASESQYADHPEDYLDFEKREEDVEEVSRDQIRSFMSRQVLTVDPEMPILKAGGIMLAKGVHRLPVMQDGKLVGIVTRHDIFGRILRQHFNF